MLHCWGRGGTKARKALDGVLKVLSNIICVSDIANEVVICNEEAGDENKKGKVFRFVTSIYYNCGYFLTFYTLLSSAMKT